MNAAQRVRRELEAMREVDLVSAAEFDAAVARLERSPAEVAGWYGNSMSASECADLLLELVRVAK